MHEWVENALAHLKNRADDFGYSGPICDLPTLRSLRSFKSFCAEYSVIRGRGVDNVSLRERVYQNLKTIRTASSIEDFTVEMGWQGDLITPRQEWSAASKLLFFWKPHRFAPWDQYARAGIMRYRRKKAFHTPSQYLAIFDESLAMWLANDSEGWEATGDFKDRVAFDSWLMSKGGRTYN